jgi:hypothetical protein
MEIGGSKQHEEKTVAGPSDTGHALAMLLSSETISPNSAAPGQLIKKESERIKLLLA